MLADSKAAGLAALPVAGPGLEAALSPPLGALPPCCANWPELLAGRPKLGGAPASCALRLHGLLCERSCGRCCLKSCNLAVGSCGSQAGAGSSFCYWQPASRCLPRWHAFGAEWQKVAAHNPGHAGIPRKGRCSRWQPTFICSLTARCLACCACFLRSACHAAAVASSLNTHSSAWLLPSCTHQQEAVPVTQAVHPLGNTCKMPCPGHLPITGRLLGRPCSVTD